MSATSPGRRALETSEGASNKKEKRALVVAYNVAEARTYCDQLRSLFADAVTLEPRILSGAKPQAEPSLYDLVLAPCHEALEKACGSERLPADIIFAKRTVSKEGLARLAAAAEDGAVKTPLMLVDETLGMAARMIESLRGMGIRDIALEPADPRSDFVKRDLVLIGEPSTAALAKAARIIELGGAFLDVSTILDFGIRLGLDPLFHRHSIQNSYKELATANRGLAEVLGTMNSCEGSLDIILKTIDAGVVGIDARGLVSSCSRQAAQLLALDPRAVEGKPASQVLPRFDFASVLETKSPVMDRLEKIRNREISYSIDPILHSGILYGAVAVFSDRGRSAKRPYRIDAYQLAKGYRARYTFGDLVAESPSMRRCRDIAKKTADSASSVLIYGESGTGKEVIAQAIHNASERKGRPFVAVNCGALPESLLESELFGYEEGAFTGARRGGKPGLFELAHHGTLFLDEMGGMPPSIQMKLLRAIEEREVMRLGGDRMIGVDIRVISATNRDMGALVAESLFREDLYYRLNVLPIFIPPLRERPEDVLPLVRKFQTQFGFFFDMDKETERLLVSYAWPGNARELRNCVEYISNLGIKRLGVEDLPQNFCRTAPRGGHAPAQPAIAPEKRKELLVLEELERAWKSRTRTGRRGISKAAAERGIFLGEQETRSILKKLAERGLVEIGLGRGGSLITEAGRERLRQG